MLKSSRNNRSHDSGMTIIEFVIVMGILSIVMLAVTSMFIPAKRSTAVQTQVSDVHSNLRLALRVMTEDLYTAGFLEQLWPVVFYNAVGVSTAQNPFTDYRADTISDVGTQLPASPDFIIRTRVVGDGFARVTNSAVSGLLVRLTVSDATMLNNFPVDSQVRIYQSLSATETPPDPDPPASPYSSTNRVYTVDSLDATGPFIYLTGSGTAFTALTALAAFAQEQLNEAVAVRVRDNGQPPLQTIRYRFDSAEQALVREVNDAVNDRQILARNVDVTNSSFTYGTAPDGRVNQVNIILTGITKQIGVEDQLGSAKSRAIVSTVKLRNVY